MSGLHARARRIQERLVVRAWEVRQRAYTKGVWFRMRRVLTDTERAFVIEPEDAAALLRRGLRPEPAGLELHPPRHLYFVSREELAGLVSAREIPVRLDAELLEAEHIALLRFP